MILFPIFLNEGIEITASIEKNYFDIQQAIQAAASSAGRNSNEVLLLAVSKTVGISHIKEAVTQGIHDFGENRSQLLTQKQEALPSERWHFIGRIQTNKIKEIVKSACLIHSVASERALEAINKRAGNQNKRQEVLIEVNVSGEESKEGATAEKVPKLLELASSLPHVQVKGFMTMAPVATLATDQRPRRCFAALRELRDNLVAVCAGEENISLNELSMGMSDDYEDAVKEGATIVRIGRRLWS